jgi:hypothetical protein
MRVEGIAHTEGHGLDSVPPVGFEHLGILSVMVNDVEDKVEQYAEFAKDLRGESPRLDGVRRTQQFIAEQKANA